MDIVVFSVDLTPLPTSVCGKPTIEPQDIVVLHAAGEDQQNHGSWQPRETGGAKRAAGRDSFALFLQRGREVEVGQFAIRRRRPGDDGAKRMGHPRQ